MRFIFVSTSTLFNTESMSSITVFLTNSRLFMTVKTFTWWIKESLPNNL